MPDPDRTLTYGDDPAQVVDVRVPAAPTGLPLVVTIHGGFWYAAYDRSLMEPLVVDLVARGFPVANLEYRGTGRGGTGGWPETFEDVANGVDLLADLVAEHGGPIVIGHSAGGHLALWAAARARLPRGRVGADPVVVPTSVVGLAAVGDLRAAARDGLGKDAVSKLLGAPPSEVPERVRVAAPIASLPLRVPQLLVHGRQDELVPPSQTETYARLAAAAGDDVEVVYVTGDHFSMLDPGHPAWLEVVERLPERR